MTIFRSVALFLAAAVLETGGAWLVCQGTREHRGWAWIGAGSFARGMALDGYRPDRNDITGALICLVGVAVIMYAPRGSQAFEPGSLKLQSSEGDEHHRPISKF